MYLVFWKVRKITDLSFLILLLLNLNENPQRFLTTTGLGMYLVGCIPYFTYFTYPTENEK